MSQPGGPSDPGVPPRQGARRRSRGTRGTSQAMHDSFTTFKTASDMLNTASKTLDRTAMMMALDSEANKKTLDNLAASLSGLGPVISGTQTPGPSSVHWSTGGFGYPPTGVFGASGQAGQQGGGQPGSWGANGYPGGTGYGMGVQGQGGIPAGGHGLAGLRSMAARAMHQQYGTASYEYRTAGFGTNGEQLYQAFDRNGVAVTQRGTQQQVNDEIGASGRGILSSMAGGAGGFGHGLGNTLRGARSTMEGLAERGGAVGGAAKFGLRAIPVVGTAIMAGEAAWDAAKFIGEQRQANAAYQNIYGGSNVSGMGERFLGAAYSVGQVLSGGLTPGQSSEAFKGVSALGYSGGARQDRLDFIQSNYKSFGTTVSQSMEMVTTAANNFTSTLGELHNQLGLVRDMAVKTGQNVGAMHEAFVQNFNLTSSLSLGASAAPVATALTATGPGMGREFAQYGAQPMYSTLRQQYITSSLMGYSNPGVMMGDATRNPEVLGLATDQAIKGFIKSIPPTARALIEKMINDRGGPQAMSSSMAEDIAADHKVTTLLEPIGMEKMLQFWGLKVLPGQTLKNYAYAVGLIAKEMPGGTSVAADVAKADRVNMPVSQKKDPAGYQAAQERGTWLGASAGWGDWKPKGSPDRQSLNIGWSHGHGMADPVVEHLMRDYHPDTMVTVQTGDGPVQVTMRTAITKYRDQVIDGTALLPGGARISSKYHQEYYKGKNPYGDSTAKSSSQDYAYGRFGPQIARQHLTQEQQELLPFFRHFTNSKGLLTAAKGLAEQTAEGVAATNGQIQLYMTPELRRYIRANTSGSVTQEADTQGSPVYRDPLGASFKPFG
jgi:hypothetical protein